MLLRRAGLTASAGLSCYRTFFTSVVGVVLHALLHSDLLIKRSDLFNQRIFTAAFSGLRKNVG